MKKRNIEICELIVTGLEQFTGDDKETIQRVNELITNIEKDPSYLILTLATLIEEFAIDKGLCPTCGEPLEPTHITNNKGLEWKGVKCTGCNYADYLN